MTIPNVDHWRTFLASPVSGDAKVLALHLALSPCVDKPATVNVRLFAEGLRMTPPEYERAFHEIRDVRVGWLDSKEIDRPQLKADALPRALFSKAPPSNPSKVKS